MTTVSQSAKVFSERLNQCLSETDAPNSIRERSLILSKLIGIPKHQAWGFLEGHQLPDAAVLEQIANEFEVETKWLSGESN
jgi:hypothetical protein